MIEARHFINGQYVASASGATFDLMNPATEELVVKVPSAGQAEASEVLSLVVTR